MDMVAFSILCAALNLASIWVAYAKRMIVYAIGMFFFFALVTGQSIQLAVDFGEINSVIYLEHYITKEGFAQSQIYLFAVLVILFVAPLLSMSHRKLIFVESFGYSIARSRWMLLSAFVLLSAFLLIFVVVGWSFFISNSRPGIVPGSTIFLVVLSLGLYPLLNQIISRDKLSLKNVALCLFSVFITALFSRIHVITYAMIFFVAWFYSSGIYLRRVSAREIMAVTGFGFLMAVMFFGVGTLRDTLAYVDGDWERVIQYAVENSDSGVLSIRYNYTASVEGMSALAGAFTHMKFLNLDGYPSDFGLSLLLRGAFQWVPGVIKDYTSPFVDYFSDGYWYPNSIVSSGIENSFVCFGWLGAIVFSLLFILTSNILSSFYVGATSPFGKFLALILIGMQVFFVRGSWFVWIGYSVSYLMVFLVFNFIFSKKRCRNESRC